MKTFLVLLFICLLFTGVSVAQFNNEVFIPPDSIASSDTNKIFLQIDNTNILKNNEYFNDFYNGHTILGYILNPKLIYCPNSKIRLESGVHLLKYSGITGYTRISPIFSINVEVFKKVNLILGTLKGDLAHGLVEPLYKYERFIEDPQENGVQLLATNRFIDADVWVSWEKFVFFGDDAKEAFSMGWSAKLKITGKESKHQLYIPVQALTYHNGGQGVSTILPQITIRNNAFGLAYEYNMGSRFLKKVGTKNYFVTYFDHSPKKLRPYNRGFGINPNLFAETENINLMFGFWYGDSYISPKGEELFQSVSYESENYAEQIRMLFTSKLEIHKSFQGGVDVGTRFESYYDINNFTFDFVYGLYIVFNRSFFLLNLNQK